MRRFFVSWSIVGLITLGLLEVALRVGFTAILGDLRAAILTSEQFFFQTDPATGWSLRPGVSGTFTNGVYRGTAHVDARGVRLNDASTTFQPGAPTTFLIGDSNAAGFEVGDNQTIAALLEQRQRAAGHAVNVVNLGVRSYGTDQAVLRARAYADLAPRTIIYLFTNNDPFDTNVLHIPGHEFGKGTFLRAPGSATFAAYNYPVPRYDAQEGSVVVFGPACEPIVHRRQVPATVAPPRLGDRLKAYLWTARALSFIRNGRPPAPESDADPLALLEDGDLPYHPDLYTTYHEHGEVRVRCAEYFESQMRALLRQLRTIPSVERVLVAQFPDNEVFDRLKAGATTPSIEMFRHLQADGTIDGHLDLGARFVGAGLDYPSLACPGDGHLCADGIAWEASEIERAFGPQLHAPSASR